MIKHTLWILLFFGSSINAQQARIDSILTTCQQNGFFNGVALVVDDGEIILHKGYGFKSPNNQKKISKSDRFYIGSITKQFASMLALQLCRDQKLDLNSSIKKYIPELNHARYDSITVYHLMTHTSGIPSFQLFKEFSASVSYTEKEMMEMMNRPTHFIAGTKYEYSNSGYYLLGIIIERVSQQSFGELLQQNILQPVKMKNTGFDTTWLNKKVAKGFWRTPTGYQPMPEYSLNTLYTSGGMYSTAHDLYRWDQALYTNLLLPDSLKTIYFSRFKGDYACGWRVHKGLNDNGQYFERHQHGGIIKGYHSFILRRIPQRQTVILLDNFYNQEIQAIKNSIWSVLEGSGGWIPKQNLSNLFYSKAELEDLGQLIDDITMNLSRYEDKYYFEEYDINTVGYRFMDAGQLQKARMVLEFNRSFYPKSWNVYDSLGEVYLKLGQKEKAKKMYQKSLDLNPKNTSATQALEKL